MENEPLTLYVEAFWLSPWTATAFVALREKGLAFQTGITMMRHGVGARDALRDKTLTGAAPVLQHGTMFVAESLAIVEYLEDVFTSPRVLPEDVRDRARARQLMSWLRIGTSALRRERPTERIFYPPAHREALSAEARRDIDDLVHVAERLGAGPSGVLFGDAFGVVDVDMAFALKRVMTGGTEVPAAVAAYADAVWARPSVHEYVAHPRPPNPPLPLGA
ncbi:MAG TPA: glutathione transferase [Kofleriaceae bacterium]|nr:glutathione transferase [Kofleriaceae bacterium]